MINKDVALSTEFKTQTKKAITSIVIFAIVYFIIFVLALGLTAFCVYFGVMLIVTVPGLVTIALGLGLASLGFLVTFFLLKFIFKKNKIDRSHLTEITESEQPELFKMIHDIVNEVGTTFPNKVFISSDVNASVFYNSNFWSMFLPIKKNLHIGLGLVNTIHTSELKAILSHEFGHFSQKTMKVGSYVYYVNQVIFNMLYDNEGFDKMVQQWANASGYFAIFVIVAVKIVQGIQWILRNMYEFVNKNYLGLSREMEFHADEIAANVTGFEPLKSALLRMNLADYSFNAVVGFYEGKIAENIISKNVFKEQYYLLNFYAKEDNLPLIDGLPDITLDELNKFNKSKLVIKDQWSSHPSTEDRISHLENTKLSVTYTANELANTLFKNIETLHETFTTKMFAEVKYEETPKTLSLDGFKDEFKKEHLKNTFSKVFNGYYDNKTLVPFEINDIDENEELPATVDALFSDKHVNRNYEALALQNDIETIKQIKDKTIKVKTYDYDGKKYNAKESAALINQLQNQLDAINEKIKANDINIFRFFKQAEINNNPSKLTELYTTFFEFDKEFDSKFKIYTELSDKLQFINVTTPYEQIKSNFIKVKSLERKLKENIKQFTADDKYKTEITKDIKESFETYLLKEWLYFGTQNYIDKNLETLFMALNNYAYILSKGYFLHKKEVLDYKVLLLDKLEVA
ncbi:M48 family metallopeptidase [Hwangdonia lutea]|uniref:M48 family metalloprotease n=1 Tax=Hwangdonia lutea TaxID=3075823 RepID=A0AA97ENC9_9FLAO|nr:M48 family metalloprotease [Hwangdonia sp. SCSIO 19198]WOD43610.1 M48 family metalloprotease [Hwangdonia sp. SCSIO 19198]